jgi:hypothetical protein
MAQLQAACASGASTSANSSADDPNSTPSEREYRRQQSYLIKEIRSRLYPPAMNFHADKNFTKQDCRLLAQIDSQLKATKLLEIQANFYNATGQLVPLHLFQTKIEAAELESHLETSFKTVNKWLDNISYAEQEDPSTAVDQPDDVVEILQAVI